jgi:uncharacterized protein YjbI with pentapeptide repeats
LANPEHVAILKQGVGVWNKWRAGQADLTPDFTRADLEDSHLEGANLQAANLKRVNLRGANLTKANLNWANLIHGGLSEAILNGVMLKDAYLIDTDLHGADLSDADLTGAQLSQVNLSLAKLKGTDFTNTLVSRLLLCETDLSQTKGLATMHHAKRSSIDITTLQISKANLPETFLKGIGLTDHFITYFSSLTGNAIEFHSTFISYSTKDQSFADRLYSDLQGNGVRCWFAPHDMRGGRKLHEQIDEAIRVYDRLLLILSEHSMTSEWVGTEISKARELEIRDGRQILFPITLAPFEKIRGWKAFDSDTGKDSAREIREYFIPDFSQWKEHASYQQAFQRLLKDLKAAATTPR